MSSLLVLPVALPLATAVLVHALGSDRPAGRGASVLGAAGLLGVGIALLRQVLVHGIQTAAVGGWVAPFGITLVADTLSAAMVVVTGLVGLAVAAYALADVEPRRQRLGFHPLLHLLLMGIAGSFVTGDVFNLYVWFEVMLMASFALLVLGGDKAQIDGAVKYVAINLVSTVCFLTAVGLLYGLTGTLNLADLHGKVAALGDHPAKDAVRVLFLVGFGVKAAVFPLFFWLPASYHTPPVAVSAVFAGLLTKVGVYAMIRLFTLVFPPAGGGPDHLLLAVAALTMLSGVLGAAAQSGFRKILSFHIVSQIGYMVLGLALFTPLALTGAVFYLLHHIVVKANLFLVSGLARRAGGTFRLAGLGGLYHERPFLAFLFLVPALSLAGFPPLSGFWAKFVLIDASLASREWLLAATALVVGFLTIYSMTKIWVEAFWKPRTAPESESVAPRADGRLVLVGPVLLLAAVTVAIGLFPQVVFSVAERAAGELLDPSLYVHAVLGGPR